MKKAWHRLRAGSRFGDWWQYKISYLLAPFYLLLPGTGEGVGRVLALLGSLLGYFIFTAAFGHVINDLGDVDADARAGKRNAWARAPKVRAAAVACLLGAAGFGCLWLAGAPGFLHVLAAVELVLFLAYSLPPARLKESRAGLLVDAGYAHVIPFAVSALILWPGGRLFGGAGPEWSAAFLVVALLWQLCSGLRGILIHEIGDYAADRAAGVRTAVVRMGQEKSERWMNRVIVPQEGGFLVAVLGFSGIHGFWLPGVGFILCGGWWLWRNRKRRVKKDGVGGWRAVLRPVFLDSFYRDLLSLLVLVDVILKVPDYWPLLPVYLALFPFWKYWEAWRWRHRVPKAVAEHGRNQGTLMIEGAYLTSRLVDRSDVNIFVTVYVEGKAVPVDLQYGPNRFGEVYERLEIAEKPVCFRICLPLPAAKKKKRTYALSVNAEWDEGAASVTLYEDTFEVEPLPAPEPEPQAQAPRAARGLDEAGVTLLYFGPTSLAVPEKFALLVRQTGAAEMLGRADRILRKELGWSLRERLEGVPVRKEVTWFEVCMVAECLYQLCIFTVLKTLPLRYGLVSAVSLGEIAAGHAAGVFGLEESVRVCCAVSLALREESGGEMLMISASNAVVAEAVRKHAWQCFCAIEAEHVSAWSGLKPEVNHLETYLKKEGIEAQCLNIPCVPHTPLVETGGMARVMEGCDFQAPRVPFFSTITGGQVTERMGVEYWERQVSEPSRLTPTLEVLSEQAFDQVIRIGAAQFGKDLHRMLAATHPEVRVLDGADLAAATGGSREEKAIAAGDGQG